MHCVTSCKCAEYSLVEKFIVNKNYIDSNLTNAIECEWKFFLDDILLKNNVVCPIDVPGNEDIETKECRWGKGKDEEDFYDSIITLFETSRNFLCYWMRLKCIEDIFRYD
jgi:hypothetical protein